MMKLFYAFLTLSSSVVVFSKRLAITGLVAMASIVLLGTAVPSHASCGTSTLTPASPTQGSFFTAGLVDGSFSNFDDAFAAASAVASGPMVLFFINDPSNSPGQSYLMAWNYWDPATRRVTGVIIEWPTIVYTCPPGYVLVGSNMCKSVIVEQYTIELTAVYGGMSGKYLAEVDPNKTSAALKSIVKDCAGLPVTGAGVKLEVNVQSNSGGHHHDDGTRHTQHVGMLAPISPSLGTVTQNGKVLTGITGNDGLHFTFAAPAIAGDHTIVATCTDGKNCIPEGPREVWVGIKNLQPLQADPNYVLIRPNADRNHPDNHYVTETTQRKIRALAANYYRRFPSDPPLHLNDASLGRGGLFDLSANWSPRPNGHSTHRLGTDIDVRANEFYHNPNESVPTSNYVDLMNTIAPKHGCNAQIHSGANPNEHFHLYCR